MKFVIATANDGKIREMSEILSAFGLEHTTREELGIRIDIAETGTTFEQNALIKAKAVCDECGYPAIADDSGLIVDALGGTPGLYTSSFGGEGLSDEERCLFLLERMRKMEQRSAKFVTSIVCAFPDGSALIASGECRGSISRIPKGSGGFGYDPVFIPEGELRTMAELSTREKHEKSHRGKALRKLYALLEDRFRSEQ